MLRVAGVLGMGAHRRPSRSPSTRPVLQGWDGSFWTGLAQGSALTGGTNRRPRCRITQGGIAVLGDIFVEGDSLPASCYILRLRSGKLYVGSTRNLEKRCEDHFAGTGCRTTQLHPPVAVAYEEEFSTYSEAFRRERQIKRWTHAKKEALIRGDMKMLHRLTRRRR
ncbi:MAG: GIY-YIG nuclease family protein [Bacteroidota bacterium]|jgi:putative endonuclease